VQANRRYADSAQHGIRCIAYSARAGYTGAPFNEPEQPSWAVSALTPGA
jgi:hypothetical protein